MAKVQPQRRFAAITRQALTTIGSLVCRATPQQMGMPADFFYTPTDRQTRASWDAPMTTQEKIHLTYVNLFRRRMVVKAMHTLSQWTAIAIVVALVAAGVRLYFFYHQATENPQGLLSKIPFIGSQFDQQQQQDDAARQFFRNR